VIDNDHLKVISYQFKKLSRVFKGEITSEKQLKLKNKKIKRQKAKNRYRHCLSM